MSSKIFCKILCTIQHQVSSSQICFSDSKFESPIPTTNDGMQNGNPVGIYTSCKHVFTRLAPICMLGRRLLTRKIASELSWKFIKSMLLVGIILFLSLFPFQSENSTSYFPKMHVLPLPRGVSRIKEESTLLKWGLSSSSFPFLADSFYYYRVSKKKSAEVKLGQSQLPNQYWCR